MADQRFTLISLIPEAVMLQKAFAYSPVPLQTEVVLSYKSYKDFFCNDSAKPPSFYSQTSEMALLRYPCSL